MTANAIFGTIAVVVLGAIVVHGCQREESLPLPRPAKVSVPAPAPKKVEAPKPVLRPRPKVAPKLPPKVKPKPGVEYHRVTKGGKLDGPISCSFVRNFVAGKTPAELEALQKEYQVSESELATYKQCFK